MDPTVHCTVEPLKKFSPVMVMTNGDAPTTAVEGAIPALLVVLIEGAPVGVTVKRIVLEVAAAEVPTAGLTTVTRMVPTVLVSVAGTIAVRLVGLL